MINRHYPKESMNRKPLFACFSILFLVLFSGTLQAQSSSSSARNLDAVVAEIGEEDVTLGDLINYYERNNLNDSYSDEDLKEFLPFYVDYKLKLVYGRDQGLYSDPQILEEFENYSKQAAFSFWLENEIKKELADEFLERSNYELKSSHVLIQLDPNSSPERREEARQQIEEALEKFENGEMSMEELNQEYSSRVQRRPAGGELPWISAGITVKPFEDALYSLEPGEISDPVLTQFGYHIIYLEEKRERTPHRKVSHIFFRGSRNDQSPEELANSAIDALEEGRTWDEVVQEFSQDGSSVNSGGDIGWIGFGSQFSPDFINAVLTTDPIASFSQPLESNYGFHILRIDSVRTYSSDEQRRTELLQQLEELPRYNATRQQVLQRLSDEGDLTEIGETEQSIQEFFSQADTTVIHELDLPGSLMEKVLVEFNKQTYTTSDFKSWLDETHSDRKATDFSNLWLEMYTEYILDSQVIPMTQEYFPEFERETEGFLNGLVVFQVSDDNIWNIETADSSALQQYYESNMDQYRFGERYDYTLVASRDDSVLTEALQSALRGTAVDSIAASFENIIITRDSVATPADEILEAINNTDQGAASETFTYRNRDANIIYHQMLEPRTMTFDEAFHRVGSDYQPVREENFMNNLRSQYRVRTYPERIR